MAVTAIRLLRIELTVSDLGRAELFYRSLGFQPVSAGELPPARTELYGAARIRETILERLGQHLALQAFDPPGAPYPADAIACDQCFQHFAMPTADIAQAVAQLVAAPISRGGPQHLPRRSGGATAFKFRDPDGHPLELIQFPDRHVTGLDHSAIVVADPSRSVDFYRDTLGLRLAAQQRNAGPEQDRLDGLDSAIVDVIALQPTAPSPHVELLAYQSPPVRIAAPAKPADLAATRLVFETTIPTPALLTDPDGHHLLLLPT